MHDKARDILEAAVALATELGLRHLTRDKVAERARVSGALVNRYFGTFEHLLDKVVAVAVERELLSIVAQAMLDHHPVASTAPRAVQERAAAHLLHG